MSGITKARVGVGRVDRDREAEPGRQPCRDVVPRGALVVGAVHAAVELQEQPLGTQRRPVHVVHAERVRLLARFLRQVARDQARVAGAPGLAAVLA